MNYRGASRFASARSVEEADMILYTGGADISPQLYSEPMLKGTYVSYSQDRSDLETWEKAYKARKFQVGICRGAQLLNVMNGGRLWQDVNNHAGSNHYVTDVETKKEYEVSSLHHQGIILNHEKSRLLAYCNDSTEKASSGIVWSRDLQVPSVDVEAFWYDESRCLGVQYHPECGPKSCVDMFFKYIETFKNEGVVKEEVKSEAA